MYFELILSRNVWSRPQTASPSTNFRAQNFLSVAQLSTDRAPPSNVLWVHFEQNWVSTQASIGSYRCRPFSFLIFEHNIFHQWHIVAQNELKISAYLKQAQKKLLVRKINVRCNSFFAIFSFNFEAQNFSLVAQFSTKWAQYFDILSAESETMARPTTIFCNFLLKFWSTEFLISGTI